MWYPLTGYGAGFDDDDPSMVMEGLPIDRDNPVGVYGGDPRWYIDDGLLLLLQLFLFWQLHFPGCS